MLEAGILLSTWDDLEPIPSGKQQRQTIDERLPQFMSCPRTGSMTVVEGFLKLQIFPQSVSRSSARSLHEESSSHLATE